MLLRARHVSLVNIQILRKWLVLLASRAFTRLERASLNASNAHLAVSRALEAKCNVHNAVEVNTLLRLAHLRVVSVLPVIFRALLALLLASLAHLVNLLLVQAR